jgi:hypothetical protein
MSTTSNENSSRLSTVLGASEVGVHDDHNHSFLRQCPRGRMSAISQRFLPSGNELKRAQTERNTKHVSVHLIPFHNFWVLAWWLTIQHEEMTTISFAFRGNTFSFSETPRERFMWCNFILWVSRKAAVVVVRER